MLPFYKIFVNEIPLVIAEMDLQDGSQYHKLSEAELVKDIPSFIKKMLDGHYEKGVLVRVNSIEDTLEILRNQFPVIVAAGGLAWNEKAQLLMIFRRGKWDLPKGKLDPGEDLETAAIREVMEETGVTGLSISEKIEVMEYIYGAKENIFLKEVHWYKMLCSDNSNLVPQTDEGITMAEWVPKDEIPDKMENTYASVKELILSFFKP